MQVTAFTSTFFDCPSCKVRTRLREVCVERDNVVHVEPDQPLVCRQCHRGLTACEARPLAEGGVLHAGWWIVCPSCYRDSFIDDTVYGEDVASGLRTVEPPKRAQCRHCGEDHAIVLADDEDEPELKATALTTTFFDCPRCQHRTHLREVVVAGDNFLCVEPSEALVCQACGYALTKAEGRPAPGGVVRYGWWFICRGCQRDSFVDETVHGQEATTGFPTESPPPSARCNYCGEENAVEVADES